MASMPGLNQPHLMICQQRRAGGGNILMKGSSSACRTSVGTAICDATRELDARS